MSRCARIGRRGQAKAADQRNCLRSSCDSRSIQMISTTGSVPPGAQQALEWLRADLEACKKLWADVQALLDKAEPKK